MPELDEVPLYKHRIDRLFNGMDYAKSLMDSINQYYSIGSRVLKNVIVGHADALNDSELETRIEENFGDIGADILKIARKGYIKAIGKEGTREGKKAVAYGHASKELKIESVQEDGSSVPERTGIVKDIKTYFGFTKKHSDEPGVGHVKSLKKHE